MLAGLKSAAVLSKAFLLVFLAATAAYADNTVIVVQPDPLIKAWADRAAHDRQQLDQSFANLGASIRAHNTIVRSVLVINCGKAQRLTRIYADGHTNIVNMNDQIFSSVQLAEAQAIYPTMQVINGCDQSPSSAPASERGGQSSPQDR